MIKRHSSEQAEEQHKCTEEVPLDFLLGAMQARKWEGHRNTHHKLPLGIKGKSVATPHGMYLISKELGS